MRLNTAQDNTPGRCEFCGTIHENPMREGDIFPLLDGLLRNLAGVPDSNTSDTTTDKPVDPAQTFAERVTDSEPYLSKDEVRMVALTVSQALRNGWGVIASSGGQVTPGQGEALNALAKLSDKMNKLSVDMSFNRTSGLYRSPF